MKINTTMNIKREDDGIGSIKSRRRTLRRKKDDILSKLARVTLSTSIDSPLKHPLMTPSTSIDTSGEISLSATNNRLPTANNCLADRNSGEDENDLIEGVDIRLPITNNCLADRNSGEDENDLIEGVDISLHCSSSASEGIDKSLYRIQRRCMKSRSRRKKKEETNSNTFQPGRFLDAVSDVSDDESTSSTVSSQFSLNFSSIDVQSDVPMPPLSPGGDDKLQIPVAQLNSVPYAHGGYASAAPLMLQDSKWMLILQHLMPDAHEDLMSLLKQPDESMPSPDGRRRRSRGKINWTDDPLRVMKWAENNPVVTAFGVISSKQGKPAKVGRKKQGGPGVCAGSPALNEWAKSLSKRSPGQSFRKKGQSRTSTNNMEENSAEDDPTARIPSIEWDVFLDPLLVKNVEQAMQQVENLSKSGDDNATIVAEIEVDRQVSRLITRMMLAHGSTAQLLAEAIGMARGYNFSRVVKASEAVRRDIGRKDWSSFPFTCGRNEDATMDETYTIPSKPILFNGEPFASPPRRNDSERTNSAVKDARTGGVFAERWLVLFASALRLGMLNEKSINNMIDEEKQKIIDEEIKE